MSAPSPESNALEQFLALLDATDREKAGGRYEELRRSLIRFFRWRGGSVPEDLADESLGRATARCGGQPIEDVIRFVHGIARLVLLEDYRRRKRDEETMAEASVVRMPPQPGDPRLDCLDECLDALAAPDRDLIVSYYSGSRAEKIERRRSLARSLSVTLTTLRVRAHRVRERLERCLHGCLEKR